MSWLSEVAHQAKTFAEQSVAKGDAFGPIEFWFNRYQTLIGVAAATVIALFSAAPVWAQLKQLKKQSDRGFYENLRQRSTQLQTELTLLQGLMSSIEIAMNAVNEVVAEAQPGYFEAPYRARLEGADNGLSSAIIAFRDGIGPTWGSQKIQAARANCLENAFRFSVRFTEILGVMQIGGTVPFHGLPAAIMTLNAARTIPSPKARSTLGGSARKPAASAPRLPRSKIFCYGDKQVRQTRLAA